MGILSKVIKHIVASKTIEAPIEASVEASKKKRRRVSMDLYSFLGGERELIN